MTQTSKPIGRPTFRIDGVRLRALRKEAGLTQLELAQRVYARAGKNNASPEVMKNSAQRWEAKGAVPADMAKHLAEELKTTIAVLQGALPEPAPSRIDEIEDHLKQLIDKGPSPRLSEALEHYREETAPVRELAIQIARRLEVAQLSQAQEEFEDLASITGYSNKYLQEPTSFEGFWMLIGTGPLGAARSEVLSGVTAVLHEVRTELQTCLENLHQSDAHVSFAKEKHWFRVTINDPRHSRLTRTLRFVRCQPNESGLQWSSPTWLDRFWVDALPHESYAYANFVTGFDAVCVPAECTNLRLAITKNPSAKEIEELGPDAQPKVVLLTAGDLAELHPTTLESLKQDGYVHDLVVNWLSADLWEKLLPLMSQWPLECWSFRLAQSRIDVLLDVPYRLWANRSQPAKSGNTGNGLSVSLVELSADGTHKSAPWRNKSVALVYEALTKSLQDAREAQTQSAPRLPAA